MQFNEKERKARNILADYFDTIYEVIPTRDFLEIHGEMGGDSRCFRYYYADGSITER